MIQIQLFGMLAEAVGKNIIIFEKEIDSIDMLKSEIIQSFPQLTKMSFKIAVNHKIVDTNLKLSKNDEIALLPPFAGG